MDKITELIKKLEFKITLKCNFDPDISSEEEVEECLIEDLYELIENLEDDDELEGYVTFTLHKKNDRIIKLRWKK